MIVARRQRYLKVLKKNYKSDDPSGTIIDFKTHKRLHDRRNSRTLWNGMVAVCLAAWAIALPAIGGALAGRWLDSHWPAVISDRKSVV